MKMDKVVNLAKKVLEDHKAEDIVVIDVREKTPFAEYYVLASAMNIRQINALKDIVEEEFAKKKYAINHIEGTPESGWLLIDAYHVIINIFSKEERERISLDQVLNKK